MQIYKANLQILLTLLTSELDLCNLTFMLHLTWTYVNLSLTMTCFNKQVRLRLDDEDTGNGHQLVPGSFGMDVPNACTIVIIAGKA